MGRHHHARGARRGRRRGRAAQRVAGRADPDLHGRRLPAGAPFVRGDRAAVGAHDGRDRGAGQRRGRPQRRRLRAHQCDVGRRRVPDRSDRLHPAPLRRRPGRTGPYGRAEPAGPGRAGRRGRAPPHRPGAARHGRAPRQRDGGAGHRLAADAAQGPRTRPTRRWPRSRRPAGRRCARCAGCSTCCAPTPEPVDELAPAAQPRRPDRALVEQVREAGLPVVCATRRRAGRAGHRGRR